MRSCIAALMMLCLPACAGTLSDVRKHVSKFDTLLAKVELAHNTICGLKQGTCPSAEALVKRVKDAPVEESVIAVGTVLETLKVVHGAVCPEAGKDVCEGSKVVLNEAIVAFNAFNDTL